jgi:hypothetical protein
VKQQQAIYSVEGVDENVRDLNLSHVNPELNYM